MVNKRKKKPTKSCKVCKCKNSGEKSKNWRQDKCNACYAKHCRKLKKERDASENPPKKRIEPLARFGTEITYREACLFAGVAELLNISRTELLKDMIDERTKKTMVNHSAVITEDEIAELGREYIDPMGEKSLDNNG